MNIYEKIDNIFSDEIDTKPKWANEILEELHEIKILLKKQKDKTKENISQDFYSFIQKFRSSMKADVLNNKYPTFYYKNKRLGVDFKGLLYDKETSKILSKDEAYAVYRYAYNNKNNIINSA
jgi:calcineurin-like phosphoesterase family protein